MSDPRYPAAVWRPGLNADNGTTTMETAVCHYTVGRDSRPIGDRGFFHFLVSRDGEVTQFARADAVCWHAGDPWNNRGPGIEVEYLDEPTIFTPEAEAAIALLVQWLETEWGIPAEFGDFPGDRRLVWRGFITHRSLIQTGDYHNDYWPYLPTPAPPPAPAKGPSLMTVMFIDFNGVKAYCVQGGIIVHEFHGTPSAVGVPQDALDFVNSTNCGLIGMSGAEWAALLKRSGVTQ